MFSQQSAVTNLQTLFPRVQFFPNDEHVTVIQVVHRLHDARSLNCQHMTKQVGRLWLSGSRITPGAAYSRDCCGRNALTSAEAVPLHYCAGDVKLLEERHPQRSPQVPSWPDQSVRARDGDSRFAGLQHHHHRFHVWDGEARVLAEAPDAHRMANVNAPVQICLDLTTRVSWRS